MPARRESNHKRGGAPALDEAFYPAIFRNMPEGFAIHELVCDEQGHGLDYRFLEVNPAFARLAGRPAAELVGQTARQVFPGLEPFWIETFSEVARSCQPAQFTRYLPQLGKFLQVSAFCSQSGRFAATYIDVSELHQAQEALRLSEHKLAAAFRESPHLMAISELGSGRIVEANEGFERLTGYSRAEALGKTCLELGLWANPEKRQEMVEALGSQGRLRGWMFALRRRSGEVRTCITSVEPFEANGEAYIIATTRDITDQQKIEEQLRQSEERYRQIVTTAREGILMIDEHNIITFANARMAEMLGNLPTELVGKPVENFLFLDDLENHGQQIDQRRQGQAAVYERRFMDVHGNPGWAMISATPLFDAQGNFKGSLGMIADITERKQAEEERTLLLEHLQILHDATQQLAALTYDFQAVVKKAADIAARMFGDTCVLALLSKSQQELNPIAMRDLDPEVEYYVRILLGRTTCPLGRGVAGQVALTGQGVRLNDLSLQQARTIIHPNYHPFLERFSMQALMVVPLRVRGKVTGTLGVVRHRSRRPYAAEDEVFLQELADRAALAVASAKKSK